MIHLFIVLFSICLPFFTVAGPNELHAHIMQEARSQRIIALSELCVAAPRLGVGNDPFALMQQIIAIKDAVIVIKFSADNRCGSCKYFAGIFLKAVQAIRSLKVKGKDQPIIYVYVDVEPFMEVMKKLSVSAIPSVLVYYNGDLVSFNNNPISAFEHYLTTLSL